MDRARRILNEISRCSVAEERDGSVISVYLPTETMGAIITQAMALQGEVGNTLELEGKILKIKEAAEILRRHYHKNEPDQDPSAVGKAWSTILGA